MSHCSMIKAIKTRINIYYYNLQYSCVVHTPLELPTLSGIDDKKRHAVVVWAEPKFEALVMISRLNKTQSIGDFTFLLNL